MQGHEHWKYCQKFEDILSSKEMNYMKQQLLLMLWLSVSVREIGVFFLILIVHLIIIVSIIHRVLYVFLVSNWNVFSKFITDCLTFDLQC